MSRVKLPAAEVNRRPAVQAATQRESVIPLATVVAAWLRQVEVYLSCISAVVNLGLGSDLI